MTKEATLAKYHNGNYDVAIFKDGTKIRYNNLDNLTPSFAESIDCTITTRCDGGCPYCYLECNESGEHADLNQPFFDTLHSGQELALNGNDLSHPDLVKFLARMRNNGVICNMTFNQKHFMKHAIDIKQLEVLGLIHGVGVSLTDSTDPNLYVNLKMFDNVVVHTIDGLLTKDDIDNMSDKNIKLLILGYKILGRGVDYFDKHELEIDNNVKYLRDNIKEIRNHFDVISFDNLALEHLDIKSHMPNKEWERLYMGDEGEYTFFIDVVNKKFAVSSLAEKQYDLMDDVDDMFRKVRGLR
jgi:hypothetical protein